MNRITIGFAALLVSVLLAACGAAQQPTEKKVAPVATVAPQQETPNVSVIGETTPASGTMETTPVSGTIETAPVSKTTESSTTPAQGEYIFGMVLVGPYNDRGWSQATYEGATYVEEKLPGTKLIYVDKVNPADRPNVTVEQIVDDFVAQGAKLIITNSDDFKDGTRQAAKQHPDVLFVHISGDDVLTGQAPPNVGNIMGQMEYGKMIAGCAAALHSERGKIAYVGPLINDETRRLVNAAFLGARYCAENLREKPMDITFEVVWIGFWFNIPGVTLDPTQVVKDFVNAGNDVIISGIDTTEALVEADKAFKAGKKVFAIPYDFQGACDQAPEVCLGVPYFNWGPSYLKAITAAREGTWKSTWEWNPPDWKDINNPDTTAVGFVKGKALTSDDQAKLDTFIQGLADGKIDLFVGPLKFQDGTVYLAEGQKATDKEIWYMPQLLEGIKGQSALQKSN